MDMGEIMCGPGMEMIELIEMYEEKNRKVLHLNLFRKYFDEIAEGIKTIEYRDKTDYWKRRIENREYDVIKFRNGYAKNAPTMLVEYKGYSVGEEYELKLGKIIEVNYE